MSRDPGDAPDPATVQRWEDLLRGVGHPMAPECRQFVEDALRACSDVTGAR